MATRKAPPNTRKRGDWFHLDTTIDGERYREPLNTKDWREAGEKAKDRIAEIKAGKVASPTGKAFARLPFKQAVEVWTNERIGKVAERTSELDRDRSKPLARHFGVKPVRTFKAEDVAAYQQGRIAELAAMRGRTVVEAIANGSGRTVNMETGVLHQIIKKAKLFNVLMDWPKPFPEHEREIGKALDADAKMHLFRVAASRPEWLIAYYAAVMAANTTGRKVEVRHLQWGHVNLIAGVLRIARSKTSGGKREVTLNADAKAALARLHERAELAGPVEQHHYVFPACESNHLDPTKPQKTWRTAWRSLVDEAARQAGRQAATAALTPTRRLRAAIAAYRQAAAPYIGYPTRGGARARFRFHDLRHQAITELREAGVEMGVIQSITGQLSARMVDHYSHVRQKAKRQATDALNSGLMELAPATAAPKSTAIN